METRFALLEAAGTYHRALARAAHRQGHHVYLLDGYRLARIAFAILKNGTDHVLRIPCLAT